MAKIFKYTLLALIISVSIFAYVYADAVRSTFIHFSHFRALNHNTYVSPNINSLNDQAISELITKARSRVTAAFGKLEASPTIIILESDKKKKQFKLYNPGKMLIVPWGNYVILDNEQRSVDITAHELAHAEISSRLGYLARMRKMPTWLDEGIALQVDFRPQYSTLHDVSASEYEHVLSLKTPQDFWSNTPEQNIKNYQHSSIVVKKTVLPIIKKKGLNYLLDKIKANGDINEIIKNEN